ncbi:unnamed protein product [Mytilus coruscus]|uniref:Glycolipid transfer protein domain-containing protein n=1 Tax=Mytilus coruscus TaxID=42192 RepID=A0A6J8BZZ1_MYTCO|nr:unnamed protein product [Mytilus coruscus]
MLAGDEDTIVRSIIREKGKAPCLIRHSDSQLEDLKHMCCSRLSTVEVDKTFNLCDMHVNSNKQMGVVMEKTKEPQNFLGPIYIHDNNDFDIFSNFFNNLRVKLIDSDTELPFCGTDKETGLVKSIKTEIPESGHILCIRHLKVNIKQKMIDDGIDKKDRESTLDSIYGDQGLVHSDDDISFDVKCEQLDDRTKELSASFHRYFATRVPHTIPDLWAGPTQPGYFDKGWTNNNSESLNHETNEVPVLPALPSELADIVTSFTTTQEQLAKESVAVVEYLGKFPGLAPHCNSKSGEEYLKTPASVMIEMSDMFRKDRPLNVYNKLTNKCEVTSGSSKRKQVHDKNYYYITCRIFMKLNGVFFRLQGRLFGFVAKDLEEKIGILETWRRCDTCDNYRSVQSMIKYEVEYGLTTFRGRVPSGSRTLLRLQRALEFILRFIDEMSMSEDEDKSSHIAHTVYKRTLANHHPWIVKKMAGFVTFMLPSRKELIETMC